MAALAPGLPRGEVASEGGEARAGDVREAVRLLTPCQLLAEVVADVDDDSGVPETCGKVGGER
jgi:hypothetical protein